MPLSAIAPRMIQAVVAIEDRRFYDHPGVDLIGTTRAVFTNLFGTRHYLSGGSTITQQLVRNTFLTSMWGLAKAREKDPRRKFTEWLMSIALERRLSKDKVLELYLNDVALGQRGSFAIHGVPEAARLFFGKDVSNLSLVEAATIAGVIQAPSRLSPFTNPERAKERRNVVLQAMVDTGFITRGRRRPRVARAGAGRRARARVRSAALRRLPDAGAAGADQGVRRRRRLHDARPAPAAPRAGRRPRRADARRRDPREAQAALPAGGAHRGRSAHRRDPRDGRRPVVQPVAVQPRRQREAAARIGLQAVRLPRRVRARRSGRPHRHHAGHDRRRRADRRSPSTTRSGRRATTTTSTTARSRSAARSRTRATSRPIKVAESTGFDNVAAFWRKFGIGTPPKGYPSIALGVFEATPFEIATAYTVFPNGGTIRPLRAIDRIVGGGKDLPIDVPPLKTVARKDTTYLVTNMMRSVLNEGTAASARGNGFTLDGAGKTGTTNDLRDAWFVGFTPELLTVVWVGLDDNQALGLSGSQAALPIWTQFMARALAGHANQAFEVPDGDRLRRHRQGHRQARHPGVPEGLPRVLPRRHRAGRDLPRPLLLRSDAVGPWASEAWASGPAEAASVRIRRYTCSIKLSEVFVRSKVFVCVFLAALSVSACRKAPAGEAGTAGTPPATAGSPAAPAGQPGAPRVRRRRPPRPSRFRRRLPAVIARVNGEDVKKEDFDRIINTMEARAGQPIPADRRDEILRGAIDQLVVYTLLSQESRNRGIKIDDAEIDDEDGTAEVAVPDAGGVRQGAQGSRHDRRQPAQGRARRPQRHQADGGRNGGDPGPERSRGEGVLRQEPRPLQAGGIGPRQPHPDPGRREGGRRGEEEGARRDRRGAETGEGRRATSPSSRSSTRRTAAPRRAAT